MLVFKGLLVLLSYIAVLIFGILMLASLCLGQMDGFFWFSLALIPSGLGLKFSTEYFLKD